MHTPTDVTLGAGIGFILDRTGGYAGGLISVAGALVVSAILVLVLARARARQETQEAEIPEAKA